VADCPSVLDPIFAKALAKDKLTRYETVTTFRAELAATFERIE